MKQNFLVVSLLLTFIFYSCGKKEEIKTTEVITKTEVDTVKVSLPIDSLAVHDHYEADHHLTKVQKVIVPKTYKNKKVSLVSNGIIIHHDVITPIQVSKESNVVTIQDAQGYYFLPKENASFPGGEKAFDSYILKNVEYPESAITNEVQGVIYANVYLDETGKVSDVNFPGKKLGSGLEQEAKRILMQSPKWNPAKHDGKAVKSKFVLPLTFKIH